MVKAAKIQEMPKGALKIEYDPEVDILTIYLQDPKTPLSYSSEAKPGVILNYARDESLSSVEVLDAMTLTARLPLTACSVDEFMDLKQASQVAGIAPVTLRTQAEKGRMWAIRLSGQWVTTRERLQQYLDSRGKSVKATAR